MTSYELAQASGVRPETISRLENEHATNPTLGTINRLAAALGVSAAWLTHGEGAADDLPPTGTEG